MIDLSTLKPGDTVELRTPDKLYGRHEVTAVGRTSFLYWDEARRKEDRGTALQSWTKVVPLPERLRRTAFRSALTEETDLMLEAAVEIERLQEAQR